MIIFDLINDEAPLFIEGVKVLFSKNKITKNNVVGITEGNRWKKESTYLNCVNRLHFFDSLDKKEINIKKELNRISITYDNFNIFACDRYLIEKNSEYQIKMLIYTFLFYEDLFKKEVTHYFTTGIAYTYNLVSYEVSKRFNIKHISFYGTRIGSGTCISLDVSNTFNEVNSLYSQFKPNMVTDKMYLPIKEFVNKPQQPAYMKNAINASTIKMVFITEFFIRFKRFFLAKKHKYDLFTRNPFELSFFKIKKIIKAKKIGVFHNSIFDKSDYSEDYFVFPLHMQPEASTLVLAPFQVDQKTAIINISKVLPINSLLYVKEHKSALGQNNTSFYKELKKYPNIKLISHKENMFELIKNSKGTINLSSTVGLESLFLKKPSIVLGNVFYNDSGLTFKAKSYLELKEIIHNVNEEDFKVEYHFKNYDARLAFYVFCINKKSYAFEFNVAKLDTKKRVLAKKNIQEFFNAIDSLIAP